MPAYRDNRDGSWRYRKWVALPNGQRVRITGTPATDTKSAAEHAEHMHIERVMHPERVQVTAPTAPQRKEMPTVREFSERFMKEYLPRQKPTERYSKERILAAYLVPYFGDMGIDEIDQSHVNAFVATQSEFAFKTVNNRLTVLSTLLRYAGPKGCKLIPESELTCHVKGMSPDIVAVPAPDVDKLSAAATDHRYRVAVLLASEAGLRVGEIRGLQWGDVKDGQLTIRRSIDQRGNVTTPKHDKKRSVPVSPRLEAALAKLPRRALWALTTDEGGPMNYERMLEAINALYVAAQVDVPVSETGVTMPWHSLRHNTEPSIIRRASTTPVRVRRRQPRRHDAGSALSEALQEV